MSELGKRGDNKELDKSAMMSKEGTMDYLPLRTRKKRRKKLRNRSSHRDDRNFANKVDKTSEKLESYYKAQGIVPQNEMQQLLDAMKEPLPTSFRITTFGSMTDEIKRKLNTDFRELFQAAETEDGQPIEPPQALKWYPEDLAWSVNAPRQLLRRDNTLSKFHKYLIAMNNSGSINRQEAVSMIPPLLLDMRPGLSVIDMCAAPGSKTAQILDMLTSGEPQKVRLSRKGLVVANDADLKRAWMLAHQLKRFGSMATVVTHHDAQTFPAFTLFDRVLCDVPCSGDGTLRKAPDLWRKWVPEMGVGLHRIQKRILQRGFELLKPGGRMVYSTCSMNPIENEAVVADALRTFGPTRVELLDVSESLPHLKRRPGMKSWRVKDTCETDTWFPNFSAVPSRRRTKVVASLFPPTTDEDFPLDRCMRLVPHDQNTGAFFIAVLLKKPVISEQDVNRGARDALMSLGELRKDVPGFGNAPVSSQTPQTFEGGGEIVKQSMVSAGGAGDTPVIDKSNAEVCKLTGENDTEEDGGTSARLANGEHDVAGIAGRSASEEKLKLDVTEDKKTQDHRLVARRGGGRQATRLLTDDPLVPLMDFNPEVLQNVANFYGLDCEDCQACLMCRNTNSNKFKKILIVSEDVRELLRHSIGSPEGLRLGYKPIVRVVHAGVRLFERTTRRDTSCNFRVVVDGLRLLMPAMKQRLITIDKEDLAKVLQLPSIPLTSLGRRESRAALMQLRSGPVVLAIDPPFGDAVVVWKAPHTIGMLMPVGELGVLKDKYNIVKREDKGAGDGQEPRSKTIADVEVKSPEE
eukprot:Plantae.Rhodophyta-Hildenbrandia_rubra.ctg14410.p1 GENE.Plantae.Rhodophyta-Hildenbrandia_rubra.ctg14410~~Plantae.Rhodophyta-Hildenbrandia_rubra.ctg14410.p1  ORF type:complete len:803 (-),score=129.36 Plantae.Rhodophyta-Hildenbrandia_rubra.ctg14410:1035-3443(-)